MPIYNREEQEIADHIIAAYKGILDLGLKQNVAELEQGVHVMQMFVTQHMLQRMAPEQWGNWYEDISQ
jgi:hypothetical protein